MPTILVSTGDASGDAHAAALVRVLRERLPDARFVGLGGPALAEAGVQLLADASALAVGGLFEVRGSLGRIRKVWRAMVRGLREEQPDLVILVDSGGFNLPLARRVRKLTRAKVFYYVAPQLWAWRSGRLRKLVSRTDRIAVLFPFERDFYAGQGVSVDYVGHPILDGPFAEASDSTSRVAAQRALGLDSARPVLVLLPGSRRNEVERHLPIQIAALARLLEQRPELKGLQVLVGLASSLEAAPVQALVRELSVGRTSGDFIRIEAGGRRLLDAADAVLTKPGTNTVELMMRSRPMVVVGRAHPVTAAILRRNLKVSWLSMPNLIAGERIVPELLQADATPDRIARELAPLLDPAPVAAGGPTPSATIQIEALNRARQKLGAPGATTRVAEIVLEMLGSDE